MSNEELAELIKKGESEHIPQLWENVKKVIFLHVNGFYLKHEDKFISSGFVIDDLEQESYFIFLKMLKAYSPEKGFKFLSYTRLQTVKHLMGTVLHIYDSCKVEPLNISVSLDDTIKRTEKEDVALIDTIEDSNAENEFFRIDDILCWESLKNSCCLNENQQKVIVKRYFENKTFTEIGEEMGISRQRAEGIEKAAIKKLRKTSAALKPFKGKEVGYYSFTSLGSYKERRASSEELILEMRERR